MKLNCVILDDYQNVALNIVDWTKIEENVNITSINQHIDDENSLIRLLHKYEIIVIMRERTPFTANLINNLPNLKLLITSGMRNKSIDLNTAKNNGIVVCGTQSLPEPAVELTWALILSAYRSIITENNNLRNGAWQSTIGLDLHGKRLGVLGLGKIGRKIAKIGIAFGMEVIAWSQNLTKEIAESCGVKLASSKEELISTSDIVTIHLLLSDRTKHLLSFDDFKLMKKTALLVNTSRAEIIDQDALIEALENKWIFGAALDVFATEPLPKLSKFRTIDNVLATPHIGYVTQNNYYNYFNEAVEDISAFLKLKPIRELI